MTFKTFGWLWLAGFALALAAALGAGVVLHMPLGKVVNVLLAVGLLITVLMEIYLAVGFVTALIGGRPATGYLGQMLLFLFLISSMLLAFNGFAYMRGEQLSGTSSVYDGVMGGLGRVLKVPAQIISAGLVIVLNGGSAYVNYVAKAKDFLEAAYYLFGLIAALAALRGARKKERSQPLAL